MPVASDALNLLLAREIDGQGPLSFARFMELALYHPDYGYYHRPLKQVGCQGDFYTSVSVGPVFGRLLAHRFSTWLEATSVMGPDAREQQILEAGAHDGRLARDILSWLQIRRPRLYESLQYWIVEPSAAARLCQAEMLGPWSGRVRWFASWPEVPGQGVQGVIFANELLDALPFFRLGWDSDCGQWFEWRVGRDESRFRWVRSPLIPTPGPGLGDDVRRWQALPEALRRLLPDGFTVEASPAMREWWSNAAGRLRHGTLLTLDYGLERDELLAPQRALGTLRSYRSHRITADPLDSPGQQDITAHINFTDLMEIGERAGLETEALLSQSRFLTQILAEAMAEPATFGDWGGVETRQFHTLTHPEHLGRAFRVLVQTRRP